MLQGADANRVSAPFLFNMGVLTVPQALGFT